MNEFSSVKSKNYINITLQMKGTRLGAKYGRYTIAYTSTQDFL